MRPVSDLLICLRFFSRLPVPATRREIALGAGGLAGAAALVPVAGLVLSLLPAVVLAVAHAMGLPPSVAAPLAIMSLVVLTGALHEDALADCADGFGGGRTRDRKLEIMRDSRIGAFGAVAIALSLYIRSVAVAAAAERGTGVAVAALLLAGPLSRTACLLPLILLPPARSDGAGASSRPSTTAVAWAGAIAFAVAILVAPLGAYAARVSIAMIVAGLGALLVSGIAWRLIGGQTGDVAGAAQQVAEAGVLIVFAAAS